MDGSNPHEQFTPTVADVIGSIIHAGKNLASHLSQVQAAANWDEIVSHIEHMHTMASLVRSSIAQAAASQPPAE
jgi:hypothetical protein